MEVKDVTEGYAMIEAILRGGLGYLLVGYALDLLICSFDGKEPWLIRDVMSLFRRRPQ